MKFCISEYRIEGYIQEITAVAIGTSAIVCVSRPEGMNIDDM